MAELSDDEARAQKRAAVAAQIERYERTKGAFAGVKFYGGPSHQPRCAEAARLDGQVLREPPMLPLQACDRPRCYCSWRAVTRWELRRAAPDES